MVEGLVCGIQKFSTEDGPGIRTTIFLKGCYLNCAWCHNPEMINENQSLIYSPNKCIYCLHCIIACPEGAISKDEDNKKIILNRNKCTLCGKCVSVCHAGALSFIAELMTVKEIIELSKQDQTYYRHTGGGITISGGDVLFNPLFTLEIINEAKVNNINVAIETSGFGKFEDLYKLAKESDYILYDIKSLNDEIHIKYTGHSNKLVLDNLKKLCAIDDIREKIIIRMPIIKDVNDQEEMIFETGKFIKNLGLNKIDLLPYHNLGISKARNIGEVQEEFETPDDELLLLLANKLESLNIKVNIMGQS